MHLVYAGSVAPNAGPPRVVEVGGTTADVAWTPVRDVRSGEIPVAGVVAHVLGMAGR